MASNYWIKLYHETLDDPKMGRLTDRQYRRVIELFLLAGDREQEGLLPPLEDIAFRLRSPEGLKEDLEVLQKIEIISVNEQGRYYITKWGDRQGPMSNTERSQRRREKERQRDYYGNGIEPSTKRECTDSVADVDKEEDVEEEKIKIREDVESATADDLIKAFVDNFGPEGNANAAAKDLKERGVIPDDIIKAIEFMEQNPDKYTCVDFKSIRGPATIEMQKRLAKEKVPDKEDPGRYLKGEYGEVGHH